MLGEMLIGFLAALWRLLKRLLGWSKTDKSKAPEIARPPDTVDTRMGVHEAGHLICAWYCTHVVKINSVTIEGKNGGRVEHMYRFPFFGSGSPNRAGMLVIGLGGIAAEGMVFGTFHSAPAESDLQRALVLSKELSSEGREWPWEEASEGKVPPFGKMFSCELKPRELYFLTSAYRFARALLARRYVEHGKVASALLTQKTLTHQKLESLLGHRVRLLFRGLFQGSFE